MTFKELKPNYAVHILHKDDIRYSQGKVVSVSDPRFQSPITPALNFNQTSTQVVDVTIDEDGEQRTYTIPETLDITYANNLVLSTSREKIQYEVETIMHRAEDDIASVDAKKQIVSRCADILSVIDPTLKEKQQTEARFTSIEKNMGTIEKNMGTMEKSMGTLLSMMQELSKKLE